MGVNYGTYATPRPDLGGPALEYWDDPQFSNFIADQVAPKKPTDVPEGSYSNITRETVLMSADTRRAPGAGYQRIDIGVEDKTFSTKEYGIEIPVDDRQARRFRNDFNLGLEATQQAIHRIKVAKEIRISALLFNATTWAGATLYTDVSAAPWDAAASAVIAPVVAAKEKVRALTGMQANTMIIGSVMYNNLLANTELKGRFPGVAVLSQKEIQNNLAGIFGLDRIIVGGAVKNTGNEGLDASLSDIWPDDYALICILGRPNDPMGLPSVCRSFVWTPENAEDYIVESYREEQTRAEIIRVRYDADEKVVDSARGHLLKIDA